MKLQRFNRGPSMQLSAVQPGGLYFPDTTGDTIEMKCQGLPDPDPNTTYCVRVEDGQITGRGKGSVVQTCDAILEAL